MGEQRPEKWPRNMMSSSGSNHDRAAFEICVILFRSHFGYTTHIKLDSVCRVWVVMSFVRMGECENLDANREIKF